MITTPNRLLVSILFVCATTAQANENKACGDVSIADMNWNSATLMAHVDQFILEHGYGCNASLVPGDTMPTGVSMTEKGEPDIAPEFWTNSHKAMLDKGVNEGRLRYAGDAFSQGGNEGFWVPKYMVDKHPELATIEALKPSEIFSRILKIPIKQHSWVAPRDGRVKSPLNIFLTPLSSTKPALKLSIQAPPLDWPAPSHVLTSDKTLGLAIIGRRRL